MLRKLFLESSRGRIAALLRRENLTAEELASRLDVTTSAVRAQLASMERDGLVRRAGQKRGTTRPSHVFELTTEVEQLLSGLYIPMLTHLMGVFASEVRPDHLKRIMRRTGKSMAADFVHARTPGSLEARVNAANQLLITQLGAVTHITRKNGSFSINGAACPIAGITGKHPSACLVVEGFLQEMIGAQVRECCDRTGRPRCCFEVKPR